MRKTYLLILFAFTFSSTYAIDYSCFEYSWTLTWTENNTIKVISDNINNYYFQDEKLLNSKILKSYQKKYFDFRVVNSSWLSDSKTNYSYTFDQYNQNKEIILKFNKTILKKTFNYELLTDNYNYNFQISNDGNKWYKISEDIRNYDLDYLKITFNNQNLINTTITDLSFYENWNNEVLVNSLSNSDINVYNSYVCNNDALIKLIWKLKSTEYFPIDISTKTFTLNLSPNPSFNPKHITDNIKKDTDNDWVIDSEDNCVFYYNPNQLDSTADSIWDVCSDKDNDGILWNVDNCPTVYNPDQKDENKNWIWDACEKDTDKDKIFDSLDNCINIYNPNQEDDDNDNIWNLCDNCSLEYNPNQKDTDWDWIGDICDKKDNRFIESNKYFFIWLIIIIIWIFWVWILIMVKKIKNTNK
jgi:hypothetical protein